MNFEQTAIVLILAGILVLFVWGKIRYDLVAVIGLIVSVLFGLVPVNDAFAGFSHPATVTIAVVLILSRGLSNSGVVDWLMGYVMFGVRRVSFHVAMLSSLSALFSTVMNNVGALALLMPVGIESSVKAKRSPAVVLMPMSFASLLGGLVTLIGTPPNIIIANFRTDTAGEPFKMFDFAPVGGVVAVVGILFISLVGWRLIPKNRRNHTAQTDLIAIDDYITEIQIPKVSNWLGRAVSELDERAEKFDVELIGLLRGKKRTLGDLRREQIQERDIFIIQAGAKELDQFLTDSKLELIPGIKESAPSLHSNDTILMEAVVQSNSRIENQTFYSLRLKKRFGAHLLAVSRQGKPLRKRLPHVVLRAGDVLLLQGNTIGMNDLVSSLGCLPLAKRRLRLGTTKKAGWAAGIFAAAILCATLGVLPFIISLTIAAVLMVLTHIIKARDIYDGIDWPVVVLIGAMIPVGKALESTGVTELLAQSILNLGGNLYPALILALIILVTMTLSDVMNNAATAVVMAPVGLSLANQLGVQADPFLMAVAIGASSSFLTPIGHQNNTLIMGPGGYQFKDYWRMGLPLELLIVTVSVPMILFVWPL